MVRHQRLFITISFLAFLATFVACSSKSSTPVSVTPAETESDTSSSEYYDPSVFDSTTVDNLYDTSTASDELPVTSATDPALTTQSQMCLAGSTSSSNSTSYNPSWYTGGSTSLPNTCLSPQGGTYGQDMLFELGLDSFGAMQSCYSMVMAQGPNACSSGMDVNTIFKMTRMALVRCFRNILDQQMALVQWAPQQEQSYQNTDSTLFLLLNLFSQDN